MKIQIGQLNRKLEIIRTSNLKQRQNLEGQRKADEQKRKEMEEQQKRFDEEMEKFHEDTRKMADKPLLENLLQIYRSILATEKRKQKLEDDLPLKKLRLGELLERSNTDSLKAQEIYENNPNFKEAKSLVVLWSQTQATAGTGQQSLLAVHKKDQDRRRSHIESSDTEDDDNDEW